MFEIVIPVYNGLTGKLIKNKTFCCETSDELSEWYEKNRTRDTKGKKKKNKKKDDK